MSIITKYDGKHQTFCTIIYKNDSLGKAVIYRTVICMMYLWEFICEVGSFGLFPGGEGHHHLIGETAVSVLTDNFVTFKPLCDRKLLVIYGKGIVAVYIAEKSKKQRPGEGPRLAFVIAEIFDFQTNLLHDLAMHSFFNCLTNFCETGDQGILFKTPAFVFGADDLVTVCDADDHSRHKYRVFLASTGRTVHHTFLLVMYHRLTTASTETAVTIPEPELISSDHCEREILWLYITEFTVFIKTIAWQQSSVQIRNQVKTFLVNREKINIIFI